jgi:hypothetical protein
VRGSVSRKEEGLLTKGGGIISASDGIRADGVRGAIELGASMKGCVGGKEGTDMAREGTTESFKVVREETTVASETAKEEGMEGSKKEIVEGVGAAVGVTSCSSSSSSSSSIPASSVRESRGKGD